MIRQTAEDGHEFNAFEAGTINAPRGLVVVQEIFGVNSHMRRVSERLASFGYRVLTPSLFDRVAPNIEFGYEPADVEKARATRSQISDEAALLDIAACAAAFGNRPVGIIGYCWGGTLAWLAATRLHHFKAAVGWYGGGIASTKAETPNCPVQLHFGALDKHIPLSDVEAVKAAQPQVEIFTYDNADHGFGCTDRSSYRQAASELAELRSLTFLAEHLRSEDRK